MNGENDKKEILEAIAGLSQKVGGLDQKVTGLSESVADLGEAISAFSSHVDEQFRVMRKEIVSDLDQKMDARFAKSEHELKDYTDRRIDQSEQFMKMHVTTTVAAAVAEITGSVRSVDEKDSELVATLQQKETISPVEAQKIMALSPFASRT